MNSLGDVISFLNINSLSFPLPTNAFPCYKSINTALDPVICDLYSNMGFRISQDTLDDGEMYWYDKIYILYIGLVIFTYISF